MSSDTNVLIVFSQDYPTLVGNTTLDSLGTVVGQNEPNSQCAILFFAEPGTVVEVGVGEKAPSAADAACAQAKVIGTAVIRELRSRHLLEAPAAPTPEPS